MLAPPAIDEVSTTRRSRRAPETLLIGIGFITIVLALFVGLERASVHSFGGNSDGATVVLEGLSISHGHLTLSGWDLSFDSFWTVDALVYAVAVGLLGLRADLLHVVPAAIALAVVIVGAAVARGRSRGLAGAIPVVAVVALLGLPSPMLAFFFLQGPWHVGTALWCLLAFCALARGRFGLGWAVGVCLLAAGALGDLQALVLGALPCLFAGAAVVARTRDLRPGLPIASAAPASAVLAVLVRWIAVRVGTFSIARGETHARLHQLPANLEHVFTWGAALLGVGGIPIGPAPALSAHEASGGNPVAQGFHVLAIALVALGILGACWSLLCGVRSGHQEIATASEVTLDDLLLFGVGGSVVLFLALCPNGNADYARYLTAGALFGVILGSRRLGQLLRGVTQPRVLRWGAVAAAVLLIGAAVDFQSETRQPAAAQPAIALSAFLLKHHLTNGVGDYWSASLVTVVSDGRVTVRPVISAPGERLVRYGRQSSASWYEGQRFQFLVYDTARPWRHVNAATAAEAFGEPIRTYTVGTYRVLVYLGGISVSAAGFTNH